MLRGFVRDTKAYPARRQMAVLLSAGVLERAIYTDDFVNAVRSLRKGDVLAVAGFRALGDNKRTILAMLDTVHDRGNSVVDAATMRRSDSRDGAKLMAEALTDLANERRGGDIGKLSKMGAEASAKARLNVRMPLSLVEKYWFDRTLQNAEVMEFINNNPAYQKPWAQSTLYRRLGERAVIAGRPVTRHAVKIARQEKLRRWRMGAVYFIRAANDRGPVKIGWSSQPIGRLNDLQVSHGHELKILSVIEGTRVDEKALHERFAGFRQRGEWFRVAGAFKTYLRALPRFESEK